MGSDEETGVTGANREKLAVEVYTPWGVRFRFGAFLILGYVLALMFRSGFFGLVEKIPMVVGSCESGSDKHASGSMTLTRIDAAKNLCMGNYAVYRISASNAVFFLIWGLLSSRVACCGGGALENLQAGYWIIKTVMWLICMVVPFLIPSNTLFYVYAWVAAVGAGMFILVQLVLIIAGSYEWSDSWMSKDSEDDGNFWQYALVGAVFVLYAGSITAIILMYIWFGGGGDCSLNLAFISITLIMGVIIAVISVMVPNVSLVPSGVIFAYCTWICFSAIQSGNFSNRQCNKFAKEDPDDFDWQMIMGFIFVGLSLFWAATSAGGNMSAFRRGGEGSGDVENIDEDPNSGAGKYLFFHSVMLLGSMYMAMLLTSWRITSDSKSSNLVDNGTGSMWVKISSQWVVTLVYIWTIAAPRIFPDRDFG